MIDFYNPATSNTVKKRVSSLQRTLPLTHLHQLPDSSHLIGCEGATRTHSCDTHVHGPAVDVANQPRAPSTLAPVAGFSFLPLLLPASPASLCLIPFCLPLCPPTRRQSVGNMTNWKGAGWVVERPRGECKLVILCRRKAVSEQISLCSAFHKTRL